MLNRRNFVKTAAASLAAPFVLTRRLAAQAPSERLAIGFVGVGTMGRYHLGALLGRDDVEVVGVCDVVQERIDSAANTVSERYKDRVKGDASFVKTFVDFRELLALPGLDGVVIATPDHWHTMPCILAARAGKHIYCEKPLTHHVAEGRRIVDEVKKAGVAFQTGSQQRSEFGGYFRKAVEYVWNGRIGKLHTVRIGVGGPAVACDLPAQETPAGTDWDRWLGPAPARPYSDVLCPRGVHQHFPAWRNYREYAGGALADMGAHHFDIAQWAMKSDRSGPIEIVPPADPKSGAGLRYVYESGVTMIHNEFEGDVRADCVFEGDAGMILVSRSGIASRPESILAEPLPEGADLVYPSSNHHANWLDCIRSGNECICPAEVGQRSASICHLGNIGYWLGRKLKWNPASEKFEGDDEANGWLDREGREEWRLV